jgi:hypothetical protein
MALSLLVGNGGALAGERVDLELVLLADASRSIDEVEVRLQREGYAAAVTHPDVLSAIAGGYERRIAVTYVEWGDETSQEVVVPWTVVKDAESAAAFARELLAAPRLGQGPNAIGSAIAAAHALIEMNAIEGTRRIIDFSGDSAYSGGGVPVAVARKAALEAGIVINGLAIYCEDCSGRPVGYDLEGAYAELIIGGPGSFVITADANLRFAEAVRRKLLLEIADRPPGQEAPAAAGAPRRIGPISPDA